MDQVSLEGEVYYKGDEVEVTATEGNNLRYNGMRGTVSLDGVIPKTKHYMVRLNGRSHIFIWMQFAAIN